MPPPPSTFRTLKAIFTLSGSMKSPPVVSGDPGHAAGGGREGAQGAWKILYVFSRGHIGHVGRAHLVVEALHELVIHGVRRDLHRVPFCFPSNVAARASFVLAHHAASGSCCSASRRSSLKDGSSWGLGRTSA